MKATLTAPPRGDLQRADVPRAGWTGDATSTSTQVSVTVNGPLVVHANWASVGILGGSTIAYSLIVVVIVVAVVIALVLARSRRRRE